MSADKTYTLSEIKAAYFAEFHAVGEIYFDSSGTEEENRKSTDDSFEEFVFELDQAKLKDAGMTEGDLLWLMDENPRSKSYKPKSFGLCIIDNYSVGVSSRRVWRYWRRYCVSIDEIINAGLTEEDAIKLNSLGWCLDLRNWEIYCICKG